jgi:ParB family chromosome partitioning protein
MTMNATTDLIRIPLHQLALSPRNARKTGGQDIDGLAASIAAHGLLQNLAVTYGTDDTGADRYEVIAGGRRLAALRQLAAANQLEAGFEVPCRVIADDDVALEASTAENTLREAMHPADQFEAFKGMVDAGKSIVDVAAHFGVDERVVKQRLKLANVDPELVQLYRDDRMELEQLQALALTDDHEAQRKAWNEPGYRGAYQLRALLTQGEVRADRSGIARFVGLDVYEGAGGKVRRDLFSSQDEVWICDRDLLARLATERLEQQRLKELEAGWSWAQVRTSMDYSERAAYGRLSEMQVDDYLAPELQARLDAIVARLQEIEDTDPDDLSRQQSDAMAEELERLENERETIDAQTEERWPADAMAKAGVLIYVDDGDVHIERGRLQPGQKVDKAGTVTGTPKPAPTKAEQPKKPTLSADMVLRLELHRAAALREYIAAHPIAATSLLLTHLLTQLLTDNRYDAVLDLRPSNVHKDTRSQIESKFGDVGKSPARKFLDERLAGWKKRGMPTRAADLYPWVDKLEAEERDELLALATALTLNTNSGARGAALAKQYGIDMAIYWQPTADSFVSVVPKALLAEAVAEVAGKTAGADLLLQKKDAAIATAAKALANTGWLPKLLRGATYVLKKPGAAKPATANKPAKKKAAPKKTAKAAAK